MQDMELSDAQKSSDASGVSDLGYFIFLVLQRWWILVSLVLVAATLSAIVSVYFIKPQYEASTTLFVYKKNDNDNTYLGGLTLGTQLVKDSTTLIKSDKILNEAISKLGLDKIITAAQLSNSITANAKIDTRIFVLTVRSLDPVRAADLANAISEVYIDELKNLIGVSSQSPNTELVNIVDRAVTNNIPVSPNVKLNIMIAALLGAALGLGIIFLLDKLDDTIRSPEVIRLHYGVDVIGFIPFIKE